MYFVCTHTKVIGCSQESFKNLVTQQWECMYRSFLHALLIEIKMVKKKNNKLLKMSTTFAQSLREETSIFSCQVLPQFLLNRITLELQQWSSTKGHIELSRVALSKSNISTHIYHKFLAGLAKKRNLWHMRVHVLCIAFLTSYC